MEVLSIIADVMLAAIYIVGIVMIFKEERKWLRRVKRIKNQLS